MYTHTESQGVGFVASSPAMKKSRNVDYDIHLHI